MVSMLRSFHKVRIALVVLCLGLLAAIPIFPGVPSNIPIEIRTTHTTRAVMLWLENNNLAMTKAVNFEVFYTNGIKENATYSWNNFSRKWEVTLDANSQRSYVTGTPGEGGWSCPGVTTSDAQPTGYWQWQGACVGEECSYGSPVFVVTGWSGSAGVLQSCA